MTMRTITCFMCEDTFEAQWSYEQALQESIAIFGNVPKEDLIQVCDDCFHRLGFKDDSNEENKARAMKYMVDDYYGT